MGGLTMRKQRIYLESYDWTVLIGLVHDDNEDIPTELLKIGCEYDKVAEIHDYFSDGILNKGVTYTNIPNKTNLVLIGDSSSEEEFINSLTHELFHVVIHICSSKGIDLEGEEPCYLMGKLCQATI